MLFSRFKTSTRTALIFTLFSSVLLMVFSLVLNLYYFYNWRSDEQKETLEKIIKISTTVFSTAAGELTDEERMDWFVRSILTQSGIVETSSSGSFISQEWKEKESNFLGMYHSGDKIYIRYTFPLEKIGTVWLPYDVTDHIEEQLLLLKISLFLLAVFLILTALVSFFFTKYSLRPLSRIIRYIHSFKVDAPIPTFPLSGPRNDEFYIVAETLSEAFKRVQSQTEVLQQFSADAAHEFKTPLMIIRSEIDYALKSGEYQDGLKNIASQVSLLDTMIRTLLTITRIEKGSIQKEEVDVSWLVESVVSENEQLFDQKGLKTVKNIEQGVLLVSNKSMLHIILSNLLNNAFRYTTSGEITISLDTNKISVQDTGIGIVKENIDKIWDRLYRVDPSRSLQNGHWLGLFLVKTIVEKLGYTIEVESEAGKGSTFTVFFEKKPKK